MPALGVLLVPAFAQMGAMLLDEGWFHRRRGLPKWERLGHPLDTLTVAACYSWTLVRAPGQPHAVAIYVALAAFSCLFVTKDELVHKRACEGWETWLHAVLFVLHPIVFLALGLVWASASSAWLLRAQLALTLAFAAYQLVYWSLPWNTLRRTKRLTARSGP
ncbi:MAG: hypothetical protein M3O36_08350 [Myxococcota bacterium]|nr:hypothetical protein [Myxococcota bacterium]